MDEHTIIQDNGSFQLCDSRDFQGSLHVCGSVCVCVVSVVQKFCLVSQNVDLKWRTSFPTPKSILRPRTVLCQEESTKSFVFYMANSQPLSLRLGRTSYLGKESMHFSFLPWKLLIFRWVIKCVRIQFRISTLQEGTSLTLILYNIMGKKRSE